MGFHTNVGTIFPELIKLETLPDIITFLTRDSLQAQFLSFVWKLILLVRCSIFVTVHFCSHLSPHSSSQYITTGNRYHDARRKAKDSVAQAEMVAC